MEDHHEDNGTIIEIEAKGISTLLMNDELASTAYCLMRRSVLFLRSAQKFIEAGAIRASLSRVSSLSSSSTTSYYTPLSSFHLEHGDLEAGGDQIQDQHDEIVADSPDVDVDWSCVNNLRSNNDQVEIELQPHDQSHQECSQITKVNEIVNEKNLDSLHNFGGVKGVAEALSSDVDKGIHDGDISSRYKATDLSLHMIFTGYGHFIRQLVNQSTILLLIVAAILSFCFGINEEGMQNGWFEGAILVAIILVNVLCKLARNWYERRHRKKQKDHKPNVIQVIRGGNEMEILASDLVYGDIACVNTGHSVPAHGLFVSGEKLELFHMDDGLSIANEQNPFLSPGSKVISGDARMIVTSVQVDKSSQKCKISETDSSFCAYFDKLNNYLHISGLLIGILIIVVVFIRFKLGHKDDENGYRSETKEEPAEIARIMNALKKILTESKGTVRVWITLLGVSLVGMTEGIPFLISIAMAYWYPNFDVKMESVSILCIEIASWLKEQTLEDSFNLDNIRQAIAILKEGRVKTIFTSEEDVEVLRTIGDETGLLNSHDALVAKGEDFCNYTVDDMKEKAEKISIMGNSSAAHKLLFIEWLKKKGEVVAVIGEEEAESNLVLETAHFGLPVVTNWPETKTYVINSIKGGRIVCENLRQLIQLEVILAITSLSINFFLVIIDGDAPLTIIQLVWVNVLVTFIGGPALLITQQSIRELKDELSSIRPRKPPITKAMWRNILVQASYQTSILVFLQYRGSAILGITPKANKSIVFNGFALCQLFNIFNARDSEQKNFFKGLDQDYWFWAFSGLYLVLQLGFIEVEPVFSNTARLNWKQWAESILIGTGTWLFDVIIKLASQNIKMDKCDFGILHLVRRWLHYWLNTGINCCYCGPRSTPNSTLTSLDFARPTSGKGWITNITRRVKRTKNRAK